jgi:hypothetical protein
MTQREIAGVLKMGSGTAVCLQAKKFEEFVNNNGTFRKKPVGLEKAVENSAKES